MCIVLDKHMPSFLSCIWWEYAPPIFTRTCSATSPHDAHNINTFKNLKTDDVVVIGGYKVTKLPNVIVVFIDDRKEGWI
jgi:hypothetical protein